MKKCEKCGSSKIKKESQNLSEKSNDNILKIYTCEECGFQRTEVVHIGD